MAASAYGRGPNNVVRKISSVAITRLDSFSNFASSRMKFKISGTSCSLARSIAVRTRSDMADLPIDKSFTETKVLRLIPTPQRSWASRLAEYAIELDPQAAFHRSDKRDSSLSRWKHSGFAEPSRRNAGTAPCNDHAPPSRLERQ